VRGKADFFSDSSTESRTVQYPFQPTHHLPLAPRGEAIERLRKQLFPLSLTLDEVAASLDRFYESPEKGPITIASALEVISLRASGADESAVQKIISDLLKNITN
jgi:hypothetical protein